MIFKCANHNIMDLTTGVIFDKHFLPIETWARDDVLGYLERRKYAGSNKIAIEIHKTRKEVHDYKLSLSDSYWACNDTSIRFEDISPYYNECSVDGVGKSNGVEPTLRLMGSFDKEWVRLSGVTFIRKVESLLVARVEALAGLLAMELGIGDTVAPIDGVDGIGNGVVLIRNLSDADKMLLDFGSVLEPESLINGYNLDDVQAMYSLVGFGDVRDYILKINLFDFVIGNSDRRRNQGNWGFYKSTEDGSVSLSPAYDFNLAYSADATSNALEACSAGIRKAGRISEALDILESWVSTVEAFADKHDYDVWRRNMARMMGRLEKFNVH